MSPRHRKMSLSSTTNIATLIPIRNSNANRPQVFRYGGEASPVAIRVAQRKHQNHATKSDQ